jgi:6-pyruvoyltetrahydropterin/6-carboxytetrahydropterin synthase
MLATISKTYFFEAAHWLPLVPDGHPCKNMHGHSYSVTVWLRGPINPNSGFVVDYNVMDEVIEPIISALDHSLLNDHPRLENPTAENIAAVLWATLRGKLPLYSIAVKETKKTEARVFGHDLTD